MVSASEDSFELAVRELGDVFGRQLRVERLGPDVGVLTATTPTVQEVAAACLRHSISFVRHLTVEMARVPRQEAERPDAVTAAAAAVVAGAGVGSELAVQTWVSGSPKIGYSAGELSGQLADELGARGFTVARAGRKQVLSCCITPLGVSLALNRAEDSLVDWPGGRVRLARDDARVSRAEFKLEELFAIFPVDLPVDGHAVDLGAAPGGWTRVLRQHGMAVWAVDPGDVAPALIADPDVHHVRTTAGEFFRGTDLLFDLVVNDMRMDPLRSCRVMVEAAGRLRRGAYAVMTLKTGSLRPVETLHRCLAVLRRKYEILFARQLHHNRHELTVVARKVKA